MSPLTGSPTVTEPSVTGPLSRGAVLQRDGHADTRLIAGHAGDVAAPGQILSQGGIARTVAMHRAVTQHVLHGPRDVDDVLPTRRRVEVEDMAGLLNAEDEPGDT